MRLSETIQVHTSFAEKRPSPISPREIDLLGMAQVYEAVFVGLDCGLQQKASNGGVRIEILTDFLVDLLVSKTTGVPRTPVRFFMGEE
jgi:hypothetical protein